MLSKNLLVVAALAVAGVAHAAPATVLDLSSGSANVIGSAASQSFEFIVSSASTGLGGLTSSFGAVSGYHITGVTFDGVALSDVNPSPKFDNFVLFDGPIAAGLHTFTVTGLSKGGSYTANLEVSAVPEPESYGLALAGLALTGLLMRRRASV
ncbi:MAG: FxDxF family PEP-CTERM protein [Pseudomonadota bacterium]